MQQKEVMPTDMKVLMNHIYEYKKGVRRMVLFTFNERFESFAITRLQSQNISYIVQPVGNGRLNLFFGKPECLDAIRLMVNKPLSQLTPEEDFILGAMLGYDICVQCERYCERKCRKAQQRPVLRINCLKLLDRYIDFDKVESCSLIIKNS